MAMSDSDSDNEYDRLTFLSNAYQNIFNTNDVDERGTAPFQRMDPNFRPVNIVAYSSERVRLLRRGHDFVEVQVYQNTHLLSSTMVGILDRNRDSCRLDAVVRGRWRANRGQLRQSDELMISNILGGEYREIVSRQVTVQLNNLCVDDVIFNFLFHYVIPHGIPRHLYLDQFIVFGSYDFLSVMQVLRLAYTFM